MAGGEDRRHAPKRDGAAYPERRIDARPTFDGFEFIEESAGISAYRLAANGLEVLLLHMDIAPVVAFMITYRVGSRNESTGETGATHFLEHLMFKGTERFNTESGTSVFARLQRHGAQVNATTWMDRTNYYELLPDEKLNDAVEIEADRMRNARLREEDIESERIVILNEFDRGENDPIRKLFHSVWSTAFVAHPYKHPTIGWRSDIEHISADQLRSFYDTYYWPNNATVSIIGSFEPVAAMAIVRKHFEPIPGRTKPFPNLHTVEPPQRGERRTIIRLAGELGAVMVAFKAPDAGHPDAAALALLAVILGSGKTSRLYRRLVDTGLATSVSADPSLHRDPGLFHVFAMLGPETEHDTVEKAILGEMDTLTAENVFVSELERAVSKMKAQVAFSRDGAFSVAAQLNEAIAAGDWKLYTTFLDRIASVTAEEVKNAAKRTFLTDALTVGYFVPNTAQATEPEKSIV
ncbi:MAG: insulinase family protein [Bacteroidetes bacterium]|nr:insulinase family protein [Bacteroidota bacterium]